MARFQVFQTQIFLLHQISFLQLDHRFSVRILQYFLSRLLSLLFHLVSLQFQETLPRQLLARFVLLLLRFLLLLLQLLVAHHSDSIR